MMSTRRILRTVLSVALLGLSMGLLAIGIAAHMGRLDLEPVLSGSMRPTFQPGDLVAAWRVPMSSLRAGDVIAFSPPGQIRREMHRIVKLSRANGKTLIATRGDANHGSDDPWGTVRLRGKYAYRLAVVVPKVGWVSQMPRGIVLPGLLIAAGLLFLFSTSKSLSRGTETGPSPLDDGQPAASNLGGCDVRR